MSSNVARAGVDLQHRRLRGEVRILNRRIAIGAMDL